MMPHDRPPAVPAPAAPGIQRGSGTVGELADGGILLPDFVFRDPGGVEVDTGMLDAPASMYRFVDRVFNGGSFFVGLDYAAVSQLLYPLEAADAQTAPPQNTRVRIADRIAVFDPERRALYMAAKPMDNGARLDYLFSPARLERWVDTPLFGEVDADGKPVLTGHEKVRREEPTTLDADEFVAAMWSMGIRAGIDIAAVRAAIATGRDERACIARRTEPRPGTDATVKEETEALHRDDSPSILPNGKIDLSRFKNHFPQVEADTCLLKKLPRRLGQPGLDTDGALLEAPLPRDFDLEDLAGFGTRIERTAKGEFLFAARSGFLNVDTQTHQISITDKIVNREGVSLRTTGNLVLSGDHYEEHGEVQERRVVAGTNMDFHADVYGRVESGGGNVTLHAMLVGGAIRNTGGVTRIDGRVSSAILECRAGEVQAAYVEGSTLIAGTVRLSRAVACDIVAEDVEIDEALGCAIAARRIRIARAGAHRSAQTLITVCVPDFTALDRQHAELAGEIDASNQRIAARRAEMDEQMKAPGVGKYLAVRHAIRSGDITLTAAQDEQCRKSTQKLAHPLFRLQALKGEIDTLEAKRAELDVQLAELDSRREAAGADIRCDLDQVTGEVAVQTMAISPDTAVFGNADAAALKHRLRDTRTVRQRLFLGESGQFSWVWTPPAKH